MSDIPESPDEFDEMREHLGDAITERMKEMVDSIEPYLPEHGRYLIIAFSDPQAPDRRLKLDHPAIIGFASNMSQETIRKLASSLATGEYDAKPPRYE